MGSEPEVGGERGQAVWTVRVPPLLDNAVESYVRGGPVMSKSELVRLAVREYLQRNGVKLGQTESEGEATG